MKQLRFDQISTVKKESIPRETIVYDLTKKGKKEQTNRRLGYETAGGGQTDFFFIAI